jgi:hypothetical protein
MCEFASFVLTKDKEFWLPDDESHEQIISKHNLNADGATGPNILRVELTPGANLTDLLDMAGWDFRIDQDITPPWAPRDNAAAMAEIAERTRAAMVRRIKEAKGFLDLRGTKIASLPAGLKVGGFLDLRGTKIASLPAGLKVGGSLYLSGTKITSLPAGLKVGGFLDLRDTKITSLPAGLKVGGSLDLRDTKISATATKPKGVLGSVYR